MVDTFNSWMSCALAMVIAWAIMSHKIKDGVIVKIGLICLSLGFLAAWLLTLQSNYRDGDAMEAVHSIIYIGMVICACGYLWRTRFTKQGRRANDWIQK